MKETDNDASHPPHPNAEYKHGAAYKTHKPAAVEAALATSHLRDIADDMSRAENLQVAEQIKETGDVIGYGRRALLTTLALLLTVSILIVANVIALRKVYPSLFQWWGSSYLPSVKKGSRVNSINDVGPYQLAVADTYPFLYSALQLFGARRMTTTSSQFLMLCVSRDGDRITPSMWTGAVTPLTTKQISILFPSASTKSSNATSPYKALFHDDPNNIKSIQDFRNVYNFYNSSKSPYPLDSLDSLDSLVSLDSLKPQKHFEEDEAQSTHLYKLFSSGLVGLARSFGRDGRTASELYTYMFDSKGAPPSASNCATGVAVASATSAFGVGGGVACFIPSVEAQEVKVAIGAVAALVGGAAGVASGFNSGQQC